MVRTCPRLSIAMRKTMSKVKDGKKEFILLLLLDCSVLLMRVQTGTQTGMEP